MRGREAVKLVEKCMHKVLIAVLFSLVLVPGSAHLAWAGTRSGHDNNGTQSSGGGGGNPDNHDNNETGGGSSSGGNPDNHDNPPDITPPS